MFAYVCAATGWTWEYVGECLTLPRLTSLIEHWNRYPPVAVTAAAFAGYKPKEKAKVGAAAGGATNPAFVMPPAPTGEDIGGALASMPQLNVRRPGHE